MRHTRSTNRGLRGFVHDPGFWLLVVLALVASTLAYQVQPEASLRIGWLGDQVLLSSNGRDPARGPWFGDELTPDAPTGRSRWTGASSSLVLPGFGGTTVDVAVTAQGWPAELAQQPDVQVLANGTSVAAFQPTPSWANYSFTIPPQPTVDGPLVLTFATNGAVFTDTTQFQDARPKGIRVSLLQVRGHRSGVAIPPFGVLLPVALVCILAYVAVAHWTQRRTAAFVVGVLLIAAVAAGLALARMWALVALPWLLGAAVVVVALAFLPTLMRLFANLLGRYAAGTILGVSIVTVLVALALMWLIRTPWYVLAWPNLRNNLPDVLMLSMLVVGLATWLLIDDGMARGARAVVGAIAAPRGATLMLAMFLAIWLGYEAYALLVIPYVGHADYSDNAVVARNLLAGRGWVVDYVTQFYKLNPGGSVTRPQETWPLLQPIWIAASFLVFGLNSVAARIPNLVFMTVLALQLYTIGVRLWDRRVGLAAVVLVLTNYLFFRLAIYATNDLAFAVFAIGAIWQVYRLTERRTPLRRGNQWAVVGRFALAGLLTGLMIVQKPANGGMIALGLGVWLLFWLLGRRWVTRLTYALVWGVLAFAVLTPYLAHNLATFGKPFSSTESRDAWLIEYSPEWDDLYSVYTPAGGLSAKGVPDQSWVLRWGFDRTLSKIARQAQEVRAFLLPPLTGLDGPPLVVGSLGNAKDEALLWTLGTWLALIGVVAGLRTKRRLLALLALCFGPYMAFLVVYWHTVGEERYFLALLPWLALFAAAALWGGYDRLAALAGGRMTPLALLLTLILFALAIKPSWADIGTKLRREPINWASDLQAYDWLHDHCDGQVVMTRIPWQVNWHSGCPTLMLPNTGDEQTFLRIARYYRARYLLFDVSNRPTKQVQQMIDGWRENDPERFPTVYRSDNFGLGPTYIVRLPDDYLGAPEVQP